MITEKEFEYIQKELEESFAYTLHDKLIFISGLLSEDKELEPILNFVNYLLYSEKDCKYFSQWNVQDLYSKIEVEKNAK